MVKAYVKANHKPSQKGSSFCYLHLFTNDPSTHEVSKPVISGALPINGNHAWSGDTPWARPIPCRSAWSVPW